MISHWRQEVWEKALAFLATPPTQRKPLRQNLEEEVLKRAHRLTIL